MQIGKTFEFDAAHRLHKVDRLHPCRNIHGHRYSITVTIYADTNNDMLVDYRSFSPFKEWIDNNLDHSLIVAVTDKQLLGLIEIDKKNDPPVFGKIYYLSYDEVTAENLALHLQKTFAKTLISQNIKLPDIVSISTTVRETPNTFATAEPTTEYFYRLNF